MAGTNQYITLVASFSVMLQFAYAGSLNIHYSIMFGVLTVLSAFTGIYLVNLYVQRSGKQSIIAVILVVVLSMALVSLPINYLMKAQQISEAAKNTSA
jgi:uncharacterized membrane protein YfcA